jgi:hypothetical protein
MKCVVLLMASTGMRVGPIPDLKLKHLQEYLINKYTKSQFMRNQENMSITLSAVMNVILQLDLI